MILLYLYLRFFCGPWDKVIKAEGGYLFSRENQSVEMLPGYFVSYWIDCGDEVRAKADPSATFKEAWDIVREFNKLIRLYK